MENYSKDIEKALNEFKNRRAEIEKQKLEKLKKEKEKELANEKRKAELEREKQELANKKIQEIFENEKNNIISSYTSFLLLKLNSDVLPPYTFEYATNKYTLYDERISKIINGATLENLVKKELLKIIPENYSCGLNVKIKTNTYNKTHPLYEIEPCDTYIFDYCKITFDISIDLNF